MHFFKPIKIFDRQNKKLHWLRGQEPKNIKNTKNCPSIDFLPDSMILCKFLSTVLPRNQLSWVVIEFYNFSENLNSTHWVEFEEALTSKFVYYSLLPAKIINDFIATGGKFQFNGVKTEKPLKTPLKIIKWMGLFHMYSHNTWIHLRWKVFPWVSHRILNLKSVKLALI